VKAPRKSPSGFPRSRSNTIRPVGSRPIAVGGVSASSRVCRPIAGPISFYRCSPTHARLFFCVISPTSLFYTKSEQFIYTCFWVTSSCLGNYKQHQSEAN
jgi:hypothetical protein